MESRDCFLKENKGKYARGFGNMKRILYLCVLFVRVAHRGAAARAKVKQINKTATLKDRFAQRKKTAAEKLLKE